MGIVMVPDAYSVNPYDDVEISLVSFEIEELERTNAIIIKFHAINNGKTDWGQYMSLMYLIDHLDRKFTPNEESRSFFDDKCGLQVFFDVGPGIPEQHTICYEVPKDSENLELHIQDWDYGQSGELDNYGFGCGYRFGVLYDCNTYPPISLVPEKQIVKATAPEAVQQSGGGCGAGTILVDGVCQLAFDDQKESDLAEVGSALAAATIGIILFFVLVGIGIIVLIIIIIVILIRRRKPSTQPVKQDLDDYEKQYLSRQGQRPSPKPAEKKEASMFCDNCGAAFKKPTAKFCGGCGTPRS